MQPIVVKREQLYEEVWSTPLIKLAEKYGISDVALAKVCRRLNVPLPGRGYWDKVAAGSHVTKWPLPRTATATSATITPPRSRTDALAVPTVATISSLRHIEVPREIGRPHPITVQTRRHYKDIKRRIESHAKLKPGTALSADDWPPSGEHDRYFCGGHDGYRMTVSFDALERPLKLLDTIVKALIEQGFHVAFEKHRHTNDPDRRGPLTVTKADERFHFLLREGYSRREHTVKELLEAKKEGRYLSTYHYSPNGVLTFELVGTEYGVGKTFRDTPKGRLEEQLPVIISTFVDGVSRQALVRREREKAETERREAEQRRREQAERLKQERQTVDSLLAEAELARKFELLRDYLGRLQNELGSESKGRVFDWLRETRRLVDAYDPAVRRLTGTHDNCMSREEDDVESSSCPQKWLREIGQSDKCIALL